MFVLMYNIMLEEGDTMNYEVVSKARKYLIEIFSKYDFDRPVKLNVRSDILKQVLFLNIGYYVFISDLEDVYRKIDWSNISMEKVRVAGRDLSRYTNMKINPQTIHNKDLSNTICKGVEFIGLFDGVDITRANLSDSIDATINPQTVKNRDFTYGSFKGVRFIDTFDGCIIMGANFTGSINCRIDVSQVSQRMLTNANLGSTMLSGSFYGCNTQNTKFENAIYDKELIIDEKEFKLNVHKRIRERNK